MTRLSHWLFVALLLGSFLGLAGWFLHQRAVRGRGLPAYSVYSNEGDGLAESAHLLKQLGWSPTALTRPLPFDNHTGLLFVVLDDPDSLRKIEAQGLLRWVAKGNTLLFACDNETELHRLLNLEVTPTRQRESAPFSVKPLRTGGFTDDYTDDLAAVGLRTKATIAGTNTYPLWNVAGRPGAVALRHGRGRVLVLADPFVLTRVGLHEDDNALFLANVVALHAEDRVYFDEYHHGFRSTGGFWGYLEHHHARWALLPLAIAIAILLW